MNEILDMQILRTRLAAEPPGSDERFKLIREARIDHGQGVLYRECVQRNDETTDRDEAENHWIAEVSSFTPEDSQRITIPTGIDTDVHEAHRRFLRALPDWRRSIPKMLSDPAIWEDGGDLLMYALIETMLTRDLYTTMQEEVWMHILACTTKHPGKRRDQRHLPDIEHAWHLLDVARTLFDRHRKDGSPWQNADGWFTPNTLVRITRRSGWNVPSTFKALDRPMQALFRRYVDHHYDLALSNLHETARHKPNGRKRVRIRRRLGALLSQTHDSIDHLERWIVVRDRLVAMGITTVPLANGMLLCRVLQVPMLHEEDAMRWTLRLLSEGVDPVIEFSTLSYSVGAAAQSGWTDIVDLLLGHGASLAGDFGAEAVLGAIHCGHHAMVEHLLNRDASTHDVFAYLDSDRFERSRFADMDPDHVRAVLQAREEKMLSEVVADLPEMQAKPRRRL
ncbi:hypothetical protein [Paraburkholderia sp. C35]|uniref:hypothetical protein n=1 Tax=Paraburkholderia sp. C35 TaxID=2126993 RepID=UPI000D69C937|nr:hypothetical protein [Paraburkholderia sp. C35]